MKHEVTSREVTVHLDDAPPVEGTTTGLKVRKVEPVRVTFRYLNEDGYAEMTGPSVRDDGSKGTAHYTVKVDLSGTHHYEPAPDWVAALFQRVAR